MLAVALRGRQMSEIWLAIPDYEGFYEVSDSGRVRSVSRTVIGRWGSQRWEGRVMAQNTNRDGYLDIGLRRNGVVKKFLVHRLVLMSFFPIDEFQDLQVNHKDGVKTNNCLTNLEWCTHLENMHHMTHVLQKKTGKPANVDRKVCFRGHLLDGNTYPDPRRATGVVCATCSKAAANAYQNRKLEEKKLKELA